MKTLASSRFSLWIRAVNVFFLLLAPAVGCLAHEDNQTHARLSVASFLFLDQTYPEDGALFSSTARGQVRQGSIDEDDTPNFFNHFLNPKTGERGFLADETAAQRASHLWSTGAVQRFRASQRAGAYANLGQVLHLLQDMTSPAHVHLDVHGDPRPGEPCEGDNDDFEIWGYCSDRGTSAITQYVDYSVNNSQILGPLSIGLQRIFANQPQVSPRVGSQNTGYSFVFDLADKVYDFTSFHVILEDTPSLENDLGAGELKSMFPSLIEDGTGWRINNMGWSAGDCGNPNDQAWWMMNDTRCVEESCGFLCKKVSGYVYIENVGGGDGGGSAIPDNLRPVRYNRTWFQRRYGSINNTGAGNSNVTMLRIYGDVLYPAAVAYGAGLLQAFLDEAIMPKPVTDKPTQVTGITAQLNGRVRPAGEDASAWFEWSTNGSYVATTPTPVGAGQALTNVYARLDGLAPDTVYQCRIVSSNRFGIRHGTNQTFRTPALLVTGEAPNAWQITDRSAGSFLNYTRNLNTTLQQSATNGWRYSITARMVDDFGGSKAMNFLYGMTASKRFLVWWDLDSNGNLTAEVEGQPVRVVATNGLGATRYHTHEIIYTNGTATYRFDGSIIGTWSGVDAGSTLGGEIEWGSGSSAGMGQMNFHEVEFEISGQGLVGEYRAGTAGHPSLALNPVSQGWTANPVSPTLPSAFTPVLPDFESYLPLIETLSASEVGLTDARLNGRGDPRGESAMGWFEWGTSTAYGNATTPRDLGSGFGWTNFSEHLAGLSAGRTYHSRFVVSNAFTTVFGADQTFLTTQPVTIVATDVSQAGQFRLRFVGSAGTAYTVLRSTDLSSWLPIGQGIESPAGFFEFLDTAPPTESGYYQVRSVVP